MAPGSKTLTVSYGAFSCRLEGFDDPVETLTEIAARFRDLAAGDRLFGATHDVPDVAALRALVEAEAGRSVDLRADTDGLVLRAAPEACARGDEAAGSVDADEVPGDGFPGVDDGAAAPAPPESTPADDLAAADAGTAQADTAEPTIHHVRIRKVRADATATAAVTPEAAPNAAGDGDDLAAELAAILSAPAAVADGATPAHGADDAATARGADDADDAATAHDADDAEGAPTARDADDVLAAFLSDDAEDGEDAEDDPMAVLPADADDDLMARLAAIREPASPAEDRAPEDGDEADMSAGEGPEPSAGGACHGGDAGPTDPDMERLFAATDSRLSGAEASRRHASISHLKAAVAARRAEGPAEPGGADDTDAYRDDLASSVRPRRAPASPEGRTVRPTRTAPLMLVSSQRVEADGKRRDAPDAVRPRRARPDDGGGTEGAMPADPVDGPATDADFARFAAEVGAIGLHDVLEAAAVYRATILRQESFSRLALLHLVREVRGDPTREDGLRGFGQLLREGTIRKVGPGAFALAAGRSRYAAEAERRAG